MTGAWNPEGFMNARTPNARWSYLVPGTLLAMIMTGVIPHAASAQRVAGSFGVALTVLPRGAPQPVTVTGFHVDRNGMATFRAAAPMTIGASQLIVMRVSSSADGFTSVRVLPDVVRRSSVTEIAARELVYSFEIDRSADGVAPTHVRLRLECLVVTGT
jgi:hypothetical protein